MKAFLSLISIAVPMIQSLPFEQFQTSGFSNFDADTGTFTSGSNTNLYQETRSSNADDFLLSFEKLYPSSSSGGSNIFNPFSAADGSCDEFCQNVFALDAQSQAQFEQDFLSFQSQFGNSLNTGVESASISPQPPTKNVPRPLQPTKNIPKPQQPRTQTQVAQLPNNNVNNQKPDENFKSNNNNIQNKNFLFFGDNKKSNNRETQRPSTPKTIRQSVTKPTKTTTTAPFTVFTTSKPKTTTKTVPVKTTKSPLPVTTSRAETTSKKSTKIKWTFNGKTIGTSTITSKPPTENKESEADKLPISSYFNEVEENADRSSRKDRKINVDSKKADADFPVFDAVPN